MKNWLVVSTPQKDISQMMIIPNIWKNMFQTTNQFWLLRLPWITMVYWILCEIPSGNLT